MYKRKINVLVNGLSNTFGGVESIFYNLIQRNDLYDIHFDFISNGNNEKIIKQFQDLGSKVYTVPSFRKNSSEYKKCFHDIFSNNKYDIYHVNLTKYRVPFDILIAKKYGIKTILHSHSTQIYKTNIFIKDLIRKLEFLIFENIFIRNSDLLIACSRKAGEFLYGKRPFYILYNGIPYHKFLFSSDGRNKIRREFDIDDEDIVLGHIGRFSDEKNHIFMIHLLEELHNVSNAYKLLLVGEGDLKGSIEEMVINKHLETNVLFAGYRQDICDLLSGFDAFLLPSKHEAFPLSVIEAQVNGVKSFVSKAITNEIQSGGLVRLDINDVSSWVNCLSQLETNYQRSCKIEDSFSEDVFLQRLSQLYSSLL